ncbi:MAG: TIGR03986 family CRISPR-associated RAMP protein [Bilifractor sp.]
MAEQKIVNPYNFIPFSDKKSESDQNEEAGEYTGFISYSILTRTPLFIPNTSNDHRFEIPEQDIDADNPDKKAEIARDHKSYDFFSYKDLSGLKPVDPETPGPEVPVIPGSEIRGMLRSYYEIITNSCMSGMDSDTIEGKRTNAAFRSGLLRRNRDGTFDLFRANNCLLRTKGENSLEIEAGDRDDNPWKKPDNRKFGKDIYGRKCYRQQELSEGQKVWVTIRRRHNNDRPILPVVTKILLKDPEANRNGKTFSREKITGTVLPGYILLGEDGPEMVASGNGKYAAQQKHCAHVFVKAGDRELGRNVDVQALIKSLKAYSDSSEKGRTRPYQDFAKAFEIFSEGRGDEFFPVYYSKIGSHFMLSPAQLTREIYWDNSEALAGGFRPCSSKDKLCPACRLFGALSRNGRWAMTSRIRCSDLKPDTTWQKMPSYLYLAPVHLQTLGQPRTSSTEFYLQRPTENALFWTYDYYVDENGLHVAPGKLNGRKFYWHQAPDRLDYAADKASKLNETVRPVKAGVKFKGELYFHHITKQELDELIYVLNAGEIGQDFESKTEGYKLGTGKPLGLGSIAIGVDDVQVRKVKMSPEEGVFIDQEPYLNYKKPDFDPTTEQNFWKMNDFDALSGIKASYPTKFDFDKGVPQIYKWFGDNLYKKKPRDGIYVNGMATKREDMAYGQYMQAMDPRLHSTGIGEVSRRNGNQEGSKNHWRKR